MNKIAGVLLLSVLFFACNNEDKTKDISKDGSVETVMSVEHFGIDKDILTTKHKIWINNQLFKEYVYSDTIPSLGIKNTEGEDENGNTQTLPVKKEYEIYITVK
jgi:hypothetical protein